MIHSDVIKSLSEDEQLLLYSVAGFIFNQVGLNYFNPQWVKMLKVNYLIDILNKLATLKEEYYPTRDSLISKIKDHGGF